MAACVLKCLALLHLNRLADDQVLPNLGWTISGVTPYTTLFGGSYGNVKLFPTAPTEATMSTRTLVATLLLNALVCLPREAAACSERRAFGTRAPLIVLVTARSDTVRAGPGPITYTDADSGDARDSRPVFGQVFRLDRVGGEVPRELASARAAGRTEVVLVPYEALCGDVWRWHDSSRWTQAGSQILTDARLRPRAQWVGGRPTFDVNPDHHAYPRAYIFTREERDKPRMTSTQAFEFSRVLPTYEEVQRDAFAAYQPLLRWMRANPQLARIFPAPAAIAEAQGRLQPCVPAYDPHPVAGTYRMTVIAGADTVTGFFRTDARGYPMCGAAPLPLDLTAVRPRPADTAKLYVHGAPTEAEIPATNREANASRCSVVSANVVNRPETVAGEQRWRADFNYLVLSRCFPQSARVKEGVEAAYAAFAAGNGQGEPGTFALRPDGTATFEQSWSANGRVVLEMRGTRVSRETTNYR